MVMIGFANGRCLNLCAALYLIINPVYIRLPAAAVRVDNRLDLGTSHVCVSRRLSAEYDIFFVWVNFACPR